ncbi:C39 family peptidase [Neobacillus cucumis]|uniref:C39 family peptidase n=1 Tax=Neobacillus cucumis TaxID=1740721 RepID=UPI0020408B0C|nr:C39 family peptidase [Neobacillus cucumis]MCM3726230.1 C39 family peptidase [Neobacillus cucumis]
MKKFLIVIVILSISILGAKTIFAVMSERQASAKTLEAAPLKTREVVLQAKVAPSLPDSIKLDVPLIMQMDQPLLYNGCEVTSLAMILNYSGVKVTKNELANNIKTVPLTYSNGQKGNPNVGFVGDMAHGPGLGVYNGPVFELTKKYVGDRAVNLTDKPFTDILKEVGQGRPVWIITTSSFAPISVFQTWDTPQGKIKITFSEHSVAITGYDENYIYINDPYGGKNKKLNRESFIKAWEQMGKQAIVIKG